VGPTPFLLLLPNIAKKLRRKVFSITFPILPLFLLKQWRLKTTSSNRESHFSRAMEVDDMVNGTYKYFFETYLFYQIFMNWNNWKKKKVQKVSNMQYFFYQNLWIEMIGLLLGKWGIWGMMLRARCRGGTVGEPVEAGCVFWVGESILVKLVHYY
jgi:hypothetical protein